MEHDFDLAANIDSNRATLLGIVATLVAMVGLGRVLGDVRRDVLRVLRPAEAAVRRLIVMAAKGVVLKPSVSRPMPPGLSRELRLKRTERTKPPAFQLADPFVRMVEPVHKTYAQGPRISVVLPEDPTVTAIFQRQARKDFVAPPPVPAPDEGLALVRRLAAIQAALKDLPRQARRLVRWRARREAIALKRPIHTSPLRSGRAPYLPKTPVRDIDFVLERCHLLARDVLRADTS